jgi:hypothetical protein
MSPAQRERVMAAAQGLTEQWLHEQFNDMLGRTFGPHRSRPGRSGSFISIETSYTPGSPPPVRALPEALEERTRRVVECSACGNHHAVYSATSFCPVCGPRPAAEKVLEAIVAAREALAVEGRLGGEEREMLRDAGVFERFTVDAIESVVSLFEVFVREQFKHRVQDAQQHTKGRGNVFQRLDDTASLFAEPVSNWSPSSARTAGSGSSAPSPDATCSRTTGAWSTTGSRRRFPTAALSRASAWSSAALTGRPPSTTLKRLSAPSLAPDFPLA